MKALAHRPMFVWLAVGVAALVAVWLRTRNLSADPFWLDEAYSAFGADKGYAFIWNILPTYETHPPFYSAALHSWTLLVGNSILGFRSFGAVAGLLVLPVLWMAAREIERATGRAAYSIAVPALALAAVMPSLVDTARLVRPYYLLTLAYACTAWALLRLVRVHRETGTIDPRGWAGYLIGIAFLPWLHNLGALYVAAPGLGLLALMGPVEFLRTHWKRFLIGHALVLLAIMPAALILLDQAPTWAGTTWLRFNPGSLIEDTLLIFGLPGLFGAIAAAVLAGYAFAASGDSRIAPVLLMMALLPGLLALGLTLAITPVFLPRTLVASGAPLVLLLAMGADRSLLTRAVFGMLLLLAVVRMIQVQQLPPQENWYGVVRWLAPRMQPGDRVYAYPNEAALPFRYALRDLGAKAEVRQIPSEIPARDPAGWYASGSRGVQSLPVWRLREIARDPVSRKTPTIWLLRLSPQLYDGKDSFVKVLKEERTAKARFTDRSIDLIGFQSPGGVAADRKQR